VDSGVDSGESAGRGQVSRAALEGLAGPMSAGQWNAVQDYSVLLLENARRLSLISRVAETELGLHIVDAAAFMSVALGPEGGGGARELADLGTGAGLPGAIVAILRPNLRVTLIDSRNSRVVFLKQVQRRLGLENIEIVHSRLEALGGRRAFDLAVSRALGSLKDTLAESLRVLTPQGRLVLFKGPRWVEEEEQALAIAKSCGCELGWVKKVELPGYARMTSFVEFHVKQAGANPADAPPQ
jgi:16S rRNA (guanine527-N7)-methyltransferase